MFLRIPIPSINSDPSKTGTDNFPERRTRNAEGQKP
jgi:hypothetical protein